MGAKGVFRDVVILGKERHCHLLLGPCVGFNSVSKILQGERVLFWNTTLLHPLGLGPLPPTQTGALVSAVCFFFFCCGGMVKNETLARNLGRSGAMDGPTAHMGP